MVIRDTNDYILAPFYKEDQWLADTIKLYLTKSEIEAIFRRKFRAIIKVSRNESLHLEGGPETLGSVPMASIGLTLIKEGQPTRVLECVKFVP